MTARQAAALCAIGLALAASAALAQRSDVPYVPTPPAVVDAMLRMARVGPDDYLIDLGCGDGRIVIAAAADRGARGMGVDLDGGLVEDARRAARRRGVAHRAEFHERNLFITDIAAATVVTMYLFPGVNLELRPRLLAELRPGTRVVSHEFDLGDWRPDARESVSVPGKPYGPPRSEIYMWVVPAEVAGTWRWTVVAGGGPVPYEVVLTQRFQMLEGSASAAGRPVRVAALRLHGDEVRIRLEGDAGAARVAHEFHGRAAGDAITGTAILDEGGEVVWNAARVRRGKAAFGDAP